MGQRLALADAAVTREVIETKRPTVVGSLRDPRLTPAVHRDQPGLRAQELGHAAADRQGPRDRHRGAGRERRRADVHAGRAGHGGGDLPRRGARHRQRRALRARAADDARDAAAQRHRGADGRQPRPRRDREGGRRRARPADGVRGVRPAAARRARRSGSVIGSRPAAEALVGLELDDFEPGFIERIAARGRARRAPARGPAGARGLARDRGPRLRRSSSRCRPTPACSACST